MKEYVIKNQDAGQTLAKYLSKVLPNAGGNVIFKALRKKNITLNNAKVAGREMLKEGDSIKVFFSDETLDKFAPKQAKSAESGKISNKDLKSFEKDIVFEDGNILIVNKEPGLLSQSDASGEVSLNDLLLKYLENETKHYAVKPSVCNRLDRNTSGLVLCGKTQRGLKGLSALIKERNLRKLYYAVVIGEVKNHLSLKGYLRKDREENRAFITDEKEDKDSEPVDTQASPVSYIDVKGTVLTLLEVELVTGKPHQIRAHLLYAGFPILGDLKYFTDESLRISKELNVSRQLLHAFRVEFPAIKGDLSSLSKKCFEAPVPADFNPLLKHTVKKR